MVVDGGGGCRMMAVEGVQQWWWGVRQQQSTIIMLRSRVSSGSCEVLWNDDDNERCRAAMENVR
ncbi:hypothetical protein SESBI_03955 [Sesbania bispinosa]|nr:hypothetical protein SESBI_03955 [Sesbania bispinosa]